MQAMNFTIPSETTQTTELRVPEGYDLTAEDVAKYFGVKTAVISWRAKHGRLSALAPLLVGRDWWFKSETVAEHELEPPSHCYLRPDRETDLSKLVATRASRQTAETGSSPRARYADREGLLQQLRALAVAHGPEYLRTYNVQRKMGREGQALYSAALYYFNTWARAVDTALRPMGLSYERNVKCQKPWACVAEKQSKSTKQLVTSSL